MEAGHYGKLCPTKITLTDLLDKYLSEITPKKRGRESEARRIKRLLKDPVSLYRLDDLSPHRLGPSFGTEGSLTALERASMTWLSSAIA